MKEVKIFLQHIIESIELLEGYLKGVSKEEFVSSTEKQDLAVRRLEIIGEAVKNLPMSFRKKHPKIEWRGIAGTRDVLIHTYFAVDYNLVWAIIKKDIPKLKREVKKILKNCF
jgi:uncharacterized protein with HEPN domain